MDLRALRSTFGNAKAANRRNINVQIRNPFAIPLPSISEFDSMFVCERLASISTLEYLCQSRQRIGHIFIVVPRDIRNVFIQRTTEIDQSLHLAPLVMLLAIRELDPERFERRLAIELCGFQHMLRLGQSAFIVGRTRIGRTFLRFDSCVLVRFFLMPLLQDALLDVFRSPLRLEEVRLMLSRAQFCIRISLSSTFRSPRTLRRMLSRAHFCINNSNNNNRFV